MKQIVDGLLYDTDKATSIFEDTRNPRKPREYFQTDKGTYFCWYKLVGEIHVVDESYVRDLLAKCDPDKYVALFGAVEEGQVMLNGMGNT